MALKVDFLFSQYGEDIYKKLCDDKSTELTFGYDPKKANKFKVFEDFARSTDPSNIRNSRPYKYLDWICRQYVKPTTILLAEDFYALHKDLSDFEAWSGILHKDKKANQIHLYKSYEDLEEVLRPYQQKRAEKQQARLVRHMNDDKRAKIMAETTVVYTGPEGQIVIPHTQEASIYWGAQTRWCISANVARNMFDHYNEQHPIFMYLPTLNKDDQEAYPKYQSFKFAAVGNKVFDERDSCGNDIHPESLKVLARAAYKELSNKGKAYFSQHAGFREIAYGEKQVKPHVSKRGPDNPEYDQILDGLNFAAADYKYATYGQPFVTDKPELLNNRDFILYALRHRNWLQDLPQYQDDEDAVIATMQNCITQFEHASPRIKASKAFVMEHIKNNDYMLKHCDESLQADPEVVREALKSGNSFQYVFPHYGLHENSLRDHFRIATSPLLKGYSNLHNNRGLFIDAIKTDSSNYQYGSARLRDDEELLYMAGGYAYEYTSKRLKKRKDIAKWAYKYCYSQTEYMPKSLLRDKDFIRELFDIDYHIVFHMEKALCNDREFMEELIDKNGDAIAAVGVDKNGVSMRNDGRLIRRALETSFRVPSRLPHLKYDEAFMAEAIEKDARAACFLDRYYIDEPSYSNLKARAEYLKQQPDHVFNILMQDPNYWPECGAALGHDKKRISTIMQHYIDNDCIEEFKKYMRFVPSLWGDFDSLFDGDEALENLRHQIAHEKPSDIKPEYRPARPAGIDLFC